MDGHIFSPPGFSSGAMPSVLRDDEDDESLSFEGVGDDDTGDDEPMHQLFVMPHGTTPERVKALVKRARLLEVVAAENKGASERVAWMRPDVPPSHPALWEGGGDLQLPT